MYLRIKILTVFTLLIICNHLYSQTPKFESINISNGLSHNGVFSIEVDSMGDVWIATRNGLDRFDGFNLTKYKTGQNKNKQIAGNMVLGLASSEPGSIWMLTHFGGLNRFDMNQNKFYYYSNPTLRKTIIPNVSTICQTQDSLIWIHNNANLCVFNVASNSYQIINDQEKVNGICLNNGDTLLYYGEFGIRLMQMVNNSFVSTKKAQLHTINLLPHSNGFIAATPDYILVLNTHLQVTDTLTSISEIMLLARSITTMAISDEYLWLGAEFGLYRLPITKSKYENSISNTGPLSSSFLNEHITKTVFDRAGNLWVGTTAKGAYVYSNSQNLFQYISWNFGNISQSQLDGNKYSDPVLSICKTQSGELWLGSSKSGIGVIHPDGSKESFGFYYDAAGRELSLRMIRQIFEDSKKNIWIGTIEGLLYYNRFRHRIETVDQKFNWNWLYVTIVIKEFEAGTITVTGGNKIGEFNLQTGELTVLPNDISGIELWSATLDIEKDKNNNLWLSQNNRGLVKINASRTVFELYDAETAGFTDNIIYSLTIDGDSIWLASHSGLNLFSIRQKRVIKTYTETDGLSSNIVYSALLDGNKNLWMSTSNGITQLNPQDNTLSSYLSGHNFANFSYFGSKDTTFIFGGYNTIVQFNPELIQETILHSSPVITKFTLFNKPVYSGDTVNNRVLFKKSISATHEITLGYKQNSFSFNFNAYPFDYPNNIDFKYRLKGVQPNWQRSQGNMLMANYTTIPPGEYVFQVSASSASNDWSQPAEMRIIITPPIYMRTWFIVSVFLFVILSVIGYIRHRIVSIKQRNLWLEKCVEEQTHELKEHAETLEQQNEEIKIISDKLHEADQSKLRFFTNISHEFRTPLTIILGYLDKLEVSSKNRPKSIITRNAHRLLNLVNQLIEIRKLDQDQLELHVSKFDLIEFCANVLNSFQIIAEQKNIHLQFYSEFDKLDVWLDMDKTEKVLYNLLSNAIKYTPDNKGVLLSIKASDAEVILLIEDEGIGISDNDLQRIFERFYRSGSNAEIGYGIGLSFTKSLVEAQCGKIQVSSKVNEGTVFILNFKKGKDHFKKVNFGIKNREYKSQYKTEELSINTFQNITDKKILLVEDNIELSNYIFEELQSHYTVYRAKNGEEAIMLLKDYLPDLIISDILMPVMDGIQFCKRVKENIETSHIPFIFLTAKTDSKTQIDGFELGIDDYIEKPFEIQLLLARISAILSNRSKLTKYFQDYNFQKIEKVPTLSKLDKEFLEKIAKIVDEKYNKSEFNASMLSEMMNMSRASFYVKFKGLTGINAAEHIRKYRLNKAMLLLKEGETNISFIGSRIGFKSISQFRISFRQEYGEAPSDYFI